MTAFVICVGSSLLSKTTDVTYLPIKIFFFSILQWNLSFTTTLWFLKFWSLITGGRKTQVHFNAKGYISPSNCGHK